MSRAPATLTAAVPVRLLPDEMEAAKRLAQQAGMTRAQWMRRAIRREIEGGGRTDYTGAPGEEIYFGGLKFLISSTDWGIGGITKIVLTRY